MSNCIKVFSDDDLVKKCCRCKSLRLKSLFYKKLNRKYGVNTMCKICMNKYMKEYKKIKT